MTNEHAINTLEYIKILLALDGHVDRELTDALDVGIFAINNDIAMSEPGDK